MVVNEVTSRAMFEKTLRETEKVIVGFLATWSSPCRVISPIFEQLSEQYQGITFISVDVDRVTPVANKYSTGTIPTFVMFKNGNKFDEMLGANEGLEAKIKRLASEAMP